MAIFIDQFVVCLVKSTTVVQIILEAYQSQVPQHLPLHHPRNLEFAMQRLQNLMFLWHNGILWSPLGPHSESPVSIDSYCNRVHLVHHQILHVPLTIANQIHNFAPNLAPILLRCSSPFIQVSKVVRHRHVIMRSRPWNGEPSTSNSSLTWAARKNFKKASSFHFCPVVHESKLRPIAFCFLVEDPFLDRPFVCAVLRQHERSWHLTSDHRGWEHVSRHGFWPLSENTGCAMRMLDDDLRGFCRGDTSLGRAVHRGVCCARIRTSSAGPVLISAYHDVSAVGHCSIMCAVITGRVRRTKITKRICVLGHENRSARNFVERQSSRCSCSVIAVALAKRKRVRILKNLLFRESNHLHDPPVEILPYLREVRLESPDPHHEPHRQSSK